MNNLDKAAVAQSDHQGVKDRLDKILRGAFAGPPTQLKDIPTRKGESRAIKRSAKKKK